MDILTNKFTKSYNYISRYSLCPSYYHTLDNKYITSTAKNLRDDTLYIEYTVRKNDSYDKIALKYLSRNFSPL